MKTLNFFLAIAIIVSLTYCKADTENGTGTVREITDSTKTELQDNNQEQNEELTAYTATIKAGTDFYAHFETNDKSTVAEFSGFGEEVFLMLSSKANKSAISLNGSFDSNLKFTLKGITDQDGKQVEYTGEITPDFKLKLKEAGSGKSSLLEQNYSKGMPFEAFSFFEETESDAGSFSDKMYILFPAFEGEHSKLQELVKESVFDKKSGELQTLIKQHHQNLLTEFNNDDMGGYWTREISTEILYNDNNLISYGIHEYAYTGGAHGMGASIFFVYNLATKKTVELSDMFDRSDLKKLDGMIYEQIKTQRDMSDDDMTAEYDLPISATENFYLTPNGIHFVYNAYEITSYAMGPDVVFFHYTTLSNKLSSKFFNNLGI